MTPSEQDGSLAALIGAIADGHPATPLDKNLLRLKLVHQAKNLGLTWAQIGSVYGLTGREMKRDTHALDRRVQRELMAGRRERT
jgi:hypothetical protein